MVNTQSLYDLRFKSYSHTCGYRNNSLELWSDQIISTKLQHDTMNVFHDLTFSIPITVSKVTTRSNVKYQGHLRPLTLRPFIKSLQLTVSEF